MRRLIADFFGFLEAHKTICLSLLSAFMLVLGGDTFPPGG